MLASMRSLLDSHPASIQPCFYSPSNSGGFQKQLERKYETSTAYVDLGFLISTKFSYTFNPWNSRDLLNNTCFCVGSLILGMIGMKIFSISDL